MTIDKNFLLSKVKWDKEKWIDFKGNCLFGKYKGQGIRILEEETLTDYGYTLFVGNDNINVIKAEGNDFYTFSVLQKDLTCCFGIIKEMLEMQNKLKNIKKYNIILQ